MNITLGDILISINGYFRRFVAHRNLISVARDLRRGGLCCAVQKWQVIFRWLAGSDKSLSSEDALYYKKSILSSDVIAASVIPTIKKRRSLFSKINVSNESEE
jgi:hypothetical protein